MLTRRGNRWRGVVTVAAAALALGVSTGVADAAGLPTLRSTLATPQPVAPGMGGTLNYEITNLGATPTEGVLMNVSLPKHVKLPADRHCQRTGANPQGGDLISCNFSDELGKLAPGQTRRAATPFTVAPDAPAHADLGRIGVLVVPLKAGKPAEDWRNLTGRNTAWTNIKTN
ncbi:hypothetical protein BKA01_002365 [Pseudonocardia eucalypti]|uniref:hypothetical protein n=1 Tax=Pseudonocardia eucalypti TaxID=648755 RepID=UPI00161C76B9|nr:hypothetical protein [Pseudonocardia eucalypti]